MIKHYLTLSSADDPLPFQSSTELLGQVLPLAQNEFDDPKEFINSVCQELAINTGINFSLAFFPTNH